MKRALAERVKQEMGDPIVPPNAPPSSLPMGYASMNGVNGGTDHPPSKIPRRTNMAMASSSSAMAPVSSSSRDLPQSIAASSSMDFHSSSTSKKRPRTGPPNASSSGNADAYHSQKEPGDNAAMSKGRGAGRSRKLSAKREDSSDEDDADNSTFYLKHQNTALASELYAYRRRIYLLEREREYRRKECRASEQKIGELGGVWRGLESAIGKEVEKNELLNEKHPSRSSVNPSSTGLGTDVENAHSLLCTLRNLASNAGKIERKEPPPQDPRHHEGDLNSFENYSKGTIEMEEDDYLLEEKRRLKEMEEFASNIASRAAVLRNCVFGLLRMAARGESPASNSHSAPLLKEQIVRLETNLKSTESKLEEMANARNEAAASERRVRRGLYRLASGRMSVEEVLKAVEKEDNGVSFMETLAMIDGMNSKNVISSPGATSGVVSSSDGALSSPAFSAAVAGGSKDSSNGEEVAHLKKSLQDVQVIAETRDKKITELLAEREQQLKRINSLLLSKDDGGNSLEKEAIHNSPLFIEASTKLEISERRVKELESVNQKVMEKWARAKGDLELVKKAMSDMEEKHGRRWTELISQFSEADSTAGSPREESTGSSVSDNDPFCHAKKTAELESKLQQAMEAVSRMETLRSTLADAYKMNEQLQSKLEDLRSKNAKMVAEKVAAREKSKETESSVSASPHGPSRRSSAGGSSSTGDPAFDKLQRDYRRARKEVSAAVLSKDQAKLKQERAERERDALMRTNARLLKQSSDKDDMNAKSLSTILHLKQRNEELEKENAIVKQKAQAAQQLSLAARLSSNAKDRVGEEALKEKEVNQTSILVSNQCSIEFPH
ncbi:hypothetical protein ACHAWF_014296 [Thalassiosira exigua]